MACGTEQNTYRTLESMTLVLANGATIDSASRDADEKLRLAAPELWAGLAAFENNRRSCPMPTLHPAKSESAWRDFLVFL